MVRRRCRTILVIDSGADGDFTYDDLGNALRKIRIDMKIPIEFSDGSLRPLREGKKRCAIGRIGYSAVDGPCDDGRLIYMKPMLLGNEPPDVTSYSKSNPTFPHQRRLDQFFDESQTESYRALGRHSVLEVFHGARSGPARQPGQRARGYLPRRRLSRPKPGGARPLPGRPACPASPISRPLGLASALL